MEYRAMLNVEVEQETFGTSLDPVLNGVAQGLARLFPPVELERGSEGHRTTSGDAEADDRDD